MKISCFFLKISDRVRACKLDERSALTDRLTTLHRTLFLKLHAFPARDFTAPGRIGQAGGGGWARLSLHWLGGGGGGIALGDKLQAGHLTF